MKINEPDTPFPHRFSHRLIVFSLRFIFNKDNISHISFGPSSEISPISISSISTSPQIPVPDPSFVAKRTKHYDEYLCLLERRKKKRLKLIKAVEHMRFNALDIKLGRVGDIWLEREKRKRNKKIGNILRGDSRNKGLVKEVDEFSPRANKSIEQHKWAMEAQKKHNQEKEVSTKKKLPRKEYNSAQVQRSGIANMFGNNRKRMRKEYDEDDDEFGLIGDVDVENGDESGGGGDDNDDDDVQSAPPHLTRRKVSFSPNTVDYSVEKVCLLKHVCTYTC
jgi:hypothetical protein